MAYTPSVAVPASNPSAVLDRTLAMLVFVYVQLSRPGEVWYGGTVFRYRLVGAGSWTYNPVGATASSVSPNLDLSEYQPPATVYNASEYSWAGSTFAAGDYEMQVAVISDWGSGAALSAWSASSFFSMGTPPAAPTLTTPANGASVTAAAMTSTITHATGQSQVQIQVLNGAVVEWDSGAVNTSTGATSSTPTVRFPTNNVTRTVRARTKSSGGIWSAWSSLNTVTVAYAAPPTPTLSTLGVFDEFGVGFAHTVGFTVTHNTAGGGQVAANRMDVYARVTGSGDAVGVLIGSDIPVNHGTATPWRWYSPKHGVAYDIRVVDRASASNLLTETSSAWAAVTGTATIKGVLLHSPGTNLTQTTSILPLWAFLRYNDDELTEERDVEAALVSYAGREFPVVEYGTGGTRRYSIDLAHSKGVPVGSNDVDKVRALLEARTPVCYQDRRGRTLWGLLSVGTIKDAFYGQTLAVSIDQAYADTAPPSDVLEDA